MNAQELVKCITHGKLKTVPFEDLIGKKIVLAETSSANCRNFQTDDGDIYCIEAEHGNWGILCPVLQKVVRPDTYEIAVVFRRSYSEDIEIAKEKSPDKSETEALVEQFRQELQSAYDNPDIAIAGTFEIHHCSAAWESNS
jgi:hypothetical protein